MVVSPIRQSGPQPTDLVRCYHLHWAGAPTRRRTSEAGHAPKATNSH